MKKKLKYLRIILLIISITVTTIRVPVNVYAEEGDWVSIVSLTPNHYDNYTDPITFTAIINYSLQSKDQGIIYLGFNTEQADYYQVDREEGDHAVVSKGVGTVTLTQTVTPINWDSSVSYMQQFLNGRSELVRDFKVYANISEYPHDIPWTPLAIYEAVVTEVPEEGQVSQIQYIDEGNLQTETINTSIEKYVLEHSTDEYSPELSHLLITLCNSVHDKETMKRTFINMGFGDYTTDYKLEDPWLAYGIGKKKLSDGTTLVLVVTRGTEDIKEQVSNLDSIFLKDNRHKGFADAADSLNKRLHDFIGTDDYSNMKFVFTGHSRGAAATNLLAADMIDAGVPQENIVAYNFACPDVEIMDKEKALSYKSIYNIGNVNDTVTWVPGALLWDLDGDDDTFWNKYGQSYWFAESWEDKDAIKGKLPKGGTMSLPVTPTNMMDNIFERLSTDHSQVKYLEYLRNEYGLDKYKNRDDTDQAIKDIETKSEDDDNVWYSVLTIFCPVDVYVLGNNDELLASVEGENVYIEENAKNYISIVKMDNKKRIFLYDMKEYRLSVKGTDNGEMLFAVQEGNNINDLGEPVQRFEHVKISDGKVFSWEKETDTDTSECKLCVNDKADSDKVIAEVQPDGNELIIEEPPLITPEIQITPDVKEEMIPDVEQEVDVISLEEETEDKRQFPIGIIIISGIVVVLVITSVILIRRRKNKTEEKEADTKTDDPDFVLCIYCGNKIPRIAAFCPSCGKKQK